MSRTEKQIELEIRYYIERKLKGYVIKQHGNAFTKPGIPDLICCINGIFVAIEVKAAKGITSNAQKVHLSNINKSGGIGIIAKGEKALQHVLEVLKREDII
jgi:Holliday junction resolvase